MEASAPLLVAILGSAACCCALAFVIRRRQRRREKAGALRDRVRKSEDALRVETWARGGADAGDAVESLAVFVDAVVRHMEYVGREGDAGNSVSLRRVRAARKLLSQPGVAVARTKEELAASAVSDLQALAAGSTEAFEGLKMIQRCVFADQSMREMVPGPD